MIDLEEEIRDANPEPREWVSDGVAFIACAVLVGVVALVIAGMAKLAARLP